MTLEVSYAHRLGGFALDVDFSVEARGVTALFGPSGSGKTATVNAIAGLMRPDRGCIRLAGTTLLDTGANRMVPPHKRRLGYVFQDARLFPHKRVEANIMFGARRTADRPTQAMVDDVISLLDIGSLLGRYPANLSGGERQRVAIARALLAGPRLLLLDEPLAALDGPRKNEVLPYLERLSSAAEIPIVYVSHSIDEVTRLADRIVVLNKGSVAASGEVTEIMSRLDLFPLTGRFEAGAVVEAMVASHDAEDYLSEVTFDSGRLWLPLVDVPVGDRVRFRVRARDVVLARAAPDAISTNNILQGTVRELRHDAGTYVDVQVACGATLLLARITHRSRKRLDIAPGREVFVIVKSINLDRRGGMVPRDDPGP